jgi:exodeoxyribonuclease VII large subunit
MDHIFDSISQYDCVAILRGGGSKADLESFNHYDLAYYITQFPLPVITGIGHERDESVADMVAARGLKTPTAVAEFLVDQLLAFEFRLTTYHDQLITQVKQIVLTYSSQLERYRIDLDHHSERFLQGRAEKLEQMREWMERVVDHMLSRKRDHLTLLETRTGLVDPVNVMKRGYSMTLVNRRLITNTTGINPGDILETRLLDGTIMSKAEKITKQDGKTENKLQPGGGGD